MILLGNLLIGVGTTLSMLLNFFVILFVIRAVMSWFSPDPYNPLVRFITGCTEPILVKIRAKLPSTGVFDLSVIIAIVVLYFLQAVVCTSLIDYGMQIKRMAMLS